MKKFGLIVLSILVTSCAITIKKYIEPKEGTVATINFINNGVGAGSVELFRESDTCKGREMSEPIPLNQAKSIKVRSDSPVSFSFGYGAGGNKYCRIYGTFIPVNGAQYQAEISPKPEGCILKFHKLEGQSTIPDFSFKQRKAITNPWDENSSFCS